MRGSAPSSGSGNRGSAIGIVAALAAEARALGARAPRAWGPALTRARGPAMPCGIGAACASDGLLRLADGSLLGVSGVGPEGAARSARRLAAAGCRALASWGLAGALDPALACGAILLPEEVMLESGSTLATGLAWRRQIEEALGPRWPVCRRRLLTSARALTTVAGKAAAFSQTGAAAVDMESFAVGEVARDRGLPFVAMRVIIDTAADALPPGIAGAPDAAGRVALGRVMARAAAEPSALGGLLRLAGRYRTASRTMRAVARAGALTAYRP